MTSQLKIEGLVIFWRQLKALVIRSVVIEVSNKNQNDMTSFMDQPRYFAAIFQTNCFKVFFFSLNVKRTKMTSFMDDPAIFCRNFQTNCFKLLFLFFSAEDVYVGSCLLQSARFRKKNKCVTSQHEPIQ